MSDLRIIEELQERFGRIRKQKNYRILGWADPGYYLDRNERVIGLNLSAMHLGAIPDAVFMLSALEALELHDNEISEIPPEIRELWNLSGLGLSHNALITLPKEIGLLKRLKKLSIHDNHITDLPVTILDLDLEFGRTSAGEGIIVDGNPLRHPPIEIVNKGRSAVEAYFRAVGRDVQNLSEVKILLVGEGGAGKTSLVKKLLGKAFDPAEDTTHGITICDSTIETSRGSVAVHYWDFGGQEIMHATHQFFLTQRSLYVLVLDGRRDEKPEYWLKMIESFGGNSPVLVVLNKVDQNDSFEINRKFLQEKYAGILGIFRTSCAEDTGMAEFCEGLARALTEVNILDTSWPLSWFEVKAELESVKRHFIAYSEFTELCLDHHVAPEDQDTLLDFLHDLGVVLHFRDHSLLGTQVLDPRWVTNAVYAIINSGVLARNKGVLFRRELDAILSTTNGAYRYPKDRYSYIVDLMRKFEICYEIDRDSLLVPDLLPIEEPELPKFDGVALEFIVEYEFLPKSMMPRFIVRACKDIQGHLLWRSGVVLGDNLLRSTAIVRADQEAKRIFISVFGERRREYLATIRKNLSEIAGTFNKVGPRELVPLPDAGQLAIEYEELRGYEEEGKAEILVGKIRKSFSVAQLFDGVDSPAARSEQRDSRKQSEGVQVLFAPTLTQTVTQRIDINVDPELACQLTKLQSAFDDMRFQLAKLLPDQKELVENLSRDLDGVTPSSPTTEINGALNRAARFLKKLGDEQSLLGKTLRGAEKGMEYARRTSDLYNGIAALLGLPSL